VAPLGMQVDVFTGEMKLTIAIGNFSYLGTIGDFIKYRAVHEGKGIECMFLEKDPSWIQEFLDRVRSE
jgi:type IV pilus assembly protein PilB